MKLNLDPRERTGLAIGALALTLVIALLAYIPAGPYKHYETSRYERDRLKHDLVMMQTMKADEEDRLQRQERIMERLASRPSNFDIFSYVNNKLRESNLTGRAQLENYRTRRATAKQPMVQLRLQGVTLKELVDFLHKVYSGDDLVVMYKLDRLQPAHNNRGIDCELTLVTVKA